MEGELASGESQMRFAATCERQKSGAKRWKKDAGAKCPTFSSCKHAARRLLLKHAEADGHCPRQQDNQGHAQVEILVPFRLNSDAPGTAPGGCQTLNPPRLYCHHQPPLRVWRPEPARGTIPGNNSIFASRHRLDQMPPASSPRTESGTNPAESLLVNNPLIIHLTGQNAIG